MVRQDLTETPNCRKTISSKFNLTIPFGGANTLRQRTPDTHHLLAYFLSLTWISWLLASLNSQPNLTVLCKSIDLFATKLQGFWPLDVGRLKPLGYCKPCIMLIYCMSVNLHQKHFGRPQKP